MKCKYCGKQEASHYDNKDCFHVIPTTKFEPEDTTSSKALKRQREERAKVEGGLAFAAGKTTHQNPYFREYSVMLAWRKGWDAAKAMTEKSPSR